MPFQILTPCSLCGKERLTQRRADGSIPEVCKTCYGNGQSKGGQLGRGEKYCPCCKQVLLAEQFGSNSAKYDGLASDCKSCARKRSRARYAMRKDQVRTYHLQVNYGITDAQYEEIECKQAGVCRICGRPCSTGKRLAVDHCHRTGVVRGLLCANCNRALGLFKDSPDLLRLAAQYLEGPN